MEQKEKKRKKSSAAKGERTPGEQEAAVTENENSNMAWFVFQVMCQVIFSYCPRETRISLFILQVSSSNEVFSFSECESLAFSECDCIFIVQNMKSLSEFSKLTAQMP